MKLSVYVTLEYKGYCNGLRLCVQKLSRFVKGLIFFRLLTQLKAEKSSERTFLVDACQNKIRPSVLVLVLASSGRRKPSGANLRVQASNQDRSLRSEAAHRHNKS